MSMLYNWRCNTCLMANVAGDSECRWCGDNNRTPLQPVRVANQMQGTPSHEELSEQLTLEESKRATDKTFEELKAERTAPWTQK